MTVVNGEYLVVVQVWDRFGTLHAHEEARLEFVCNNVEKLDFYGSLNRRRDSYIGIVDKQTWKRVQTGAEVRCNLMYPPPKWTLRQKKAKDHRGAWKDWDDAEIDRVLASWPKDHLASITTEPAEPVDGDMWLDTSNVQGATLMKWSEELGGWCYAEEDEYARVGLEPPSKE